MLNKMGRNHRCYICDICGTNILGCINAKMYKTAIVFNACKKSPIYCTFSKFLIRGAHPPLELAHCLTNILSMVTFHFINMCILQIQR